MFANIPKIIIYFLIVLLIYCCIIKTIYNNRCKCINNFFVKSISGSRISGLGLAKELGYPTINIKLDSALPCGFYQAESQFGNATVIVGKNDLYRAEINFINFVDDIDKLDRLTLSKLTRLVRPDSDVITTYNAGCCS